MLAMHREVGKVRKVAKTRAAARLVAHMLTRGEQPSGLYIMAFSV